MLDGGVLGQVDACDALADGMPPMLSASESIVDFRASPPMTGSFVLCNSQPGQPHMTDTAPLPTKAPSPPCLVPVTLQLKYSLSVFPKCEASD